MPHAEHRTRLVVDFRERALPATVAPLLSAGDVACAIVPHNVSAEQASSIQALQAGGVAVLVTNDVRLARDLGADGVHLSGDAAMPDAYAKARAALGPDQIVGVEAENDRHNAMLLGEGGADYLAFGLPDGRDDLLWWSEVFEVPSVALGPMSVSDARDFSAHGVEFISVPADVEAIGEMHAAATANTLMRA